jgi:hypothetical protein
MLDPDPDELNADPQPYLEDHLLPGLQRRKLVPHSVQPQAELLTGEAHRMAVDVCAGTAAWCSLVLWIRNFYWACLIRKILRIRDPYSVIDLKKMQKNEFF